jgi:hypothetical protein
MQEQATIVLPVEAATIVANDGTLRLMQLEYT